MERLFLKKSAMIFQNLLLINLVILILSLLSFTSVIASSYPTNGEILREMSIILGIFGIGMSLFLLGCNAGAMSESKEQIKELIELLENDNGLGSR